MARWSSFIFILLAFTARSEHFSGGSITYQCLGSNNYKVILELYLDCAGQPMIPQTLNFTSSCGTTFSITNLLPVLTVDHSPVCPQQVNNTTCSGGTLPGFKYHRFEVQTYLSPCNFWNIHWNNCCRNSMVNMPSDQGMYVNATLNNTGGFCDNSPVFSTAGVPFVCVNSPMSYNAGVVDPDGHALNYSLISAQYATPTPTPVNYNSGYTGNLPIPGITLNSNTGQITFTPTIGGYYTVVLQVTSYKPSGEIIGRVMYDMMFIVPSCDGAAPTFAGLSNAQGSYITGSNQISICEGVPFCVDILFTDNDPSSDIAVWTNALAQMPGSTLLVNGNNPATATFCWSPQNVSYPLNIVLQTSDQVCPVSNSANSVITAVGCIPLNMPTTDLTGEVLDGDVVLRWNAEEVAEYRLERSDGVEPFEVLEEFDAGILGPVVHRDRAPLLGANIYRLMRIEDQHTSQAGLVHLDVRPVNITVRSIGDLYTIGPVDAGTPWELLDLSGRRVAGGMADSNGYASVGARWISGIMIFSHVHHAQTRAIKLSPVAN